MMFLFSGVLLTLAALSWLYRGTSRCARTLCVFLAMESLTCFSYGMNLASGSLEAKLAWNHLEYLFGLAGPALMPILALQVTGYERRPPAWALAAFFTVPVLGTLLNWTCRWHSLYYARVWLEPVGDLTILAKERGPLYTVVFVHVFALMVAACVIFAWRLIQRKRSLRAGQIVLIGVALLAPLVCGTPYYWLNLPWLHQVNTVHAAFFLTAVAFSAALYGGQFQGLLHALGESEARNLFLLENANAIFYTIAPDGRFSYVSDSWQHFLGHRAEAMVGRLYREVVLAEDVPACDAFLAAVVASGKLMSGIEYRVRHLDGTLHWHSSSIKPVLDSRGRAVTFVGVAHDVTEMKRAQELLRVANARLNGLIASREVELRVAVAAALEAGAGEAKRIGRDLHDGVCQELVGLLRMVENAGHHGETASGLKLETGRLVAQATLVLWHARSVASDLTLHDLDTLPLGEALSAFACRFGVASGVVIELNDSRDPGEPDAMPGAEHVYRVVREAVVNAIRHGKAHQVWIDVVHERGQMVVSVTNDGFPLPPERAAKPGVGIRQMQMRAGQLGGTITFATNAQGQTVVELMVPQGGREDEL